MITICAVVVLFSTGCAKAGWTTLDMPGSRYTFINGIDGSNLVGYYDDASGSHGFLFNGATWTTIDAPGSRYTFINGIDGSNLVGYYDDASGSHGFLFNGATWTTIDAPGSRYTFINGLDGSNLVGYYNDASGSHGFRYTIPEPATLLLLGLVVAMLRRKLFK